MGLLESVVGDLVGGGGGGGSSPMAGVLMGLLGGQGGGFGGGGQMAGQGSPAGQAPQQQGFGGGIGGGGLAGIVSAFEQAGLGHIAQSWVGNGQNLPVSPQQLQGVLGEGQVQSMAGQAGLPAQDFLSQLAQHLPNAVHAMTPNGQLPDGQPQAGTVDV